MKYLRLGAFLFLVVCSRAADETIIFNHTALERSPDSQEPTLTIYRSIADRNSTEQTELGITVLREAAATWPASKAALLKVLKRKTTLLPLRIHSTEDDAFVLADFAVDRPDLNCVEYVVIKHYPNSADDLVSVDARIRSSATKDKLLVRLAANRDQLLSEFKILETKLGHR